MRQPSSLAGAARRFTLAHAVSSLALAGLALGCNSSNGTPGGSGNDAGQDHGGTQTQDTGSNPGACPARPDLPAAAPMCTTLANTAQAVQFTALAGTAPTPAGGAIQDGYYVATSTGSYGATSGTGRRLTFVITESATRMFWSGDVLAANDGGVATSFRADTAISVSGTRITFTPSCVSTTPSPLPPALDFTVSGQELFLSLANGATVAETRYTRMGCAP